MADAARPITLFLCGDVMIGRGIDQILEHPAPPELREDFVGDARVYVGLAEDANGPIPRPVPPEYPWGDALQILDALRPDARIVNLETSITERGAFWPAKAIHYRCSPANLSVLRVAGVDVCTVANNHVLDFDEEGLLDTLDALDAVGIGRCGAGRDLDEARAPARIQLSGGRELCVFGAGHASSGIPVAWAAGASRPGIDLLPELSPRTTEELLARIRALRPPGALAVVSLHWGSNWGHEIPHAQVEFARRLIDGGVDLVHGHSSHHPRALEVYRGRLVLYGCGDFIDDYEGIGGYEAYRSELRLMYFPGLAEDGRLLSLKIFVLQSRRLRLRLASLEDTQWMAAELRRASLPFGTRILLRGAGELELRLRG